ncbi:MAG: hypothetical protein D6E12_01210 [Desulfovibrio sp.]|nr:MAG: hypothetical protein D6E12_01210 [Desulfovibrio sp.]
MSEDKKWTDQTVVEELGRRIHEAADFELIKDKEFALRALAKTFHTILKHEGRMELFYDDLLTFVETGTYEKKVY